MAASKWRALLEILDEPASLTFGLTHFPTESKPLNLRTYTLNGQVFGLLA
jgi:hypothetical protein